MYDSREKATLDYESNLVWSKKSNDGLASSFAIKFGSVKCYYSVEYWNPHSNAVRQRALHGGSHGDAFDKLGVRHPVDYRRRWNSKIEPKRKTGWKY